MLTLFSFCRQLQKCEEPDGNAEGTDDRACDQHGADAEIVEDHSADEVRENATDGDTACDEGLTFDLVMVGHGFTYIVGGSRNEDRIGEKLAALT